MRTAATARTSLTTYAPQKTTLAVSRLPFMSRSTGTIRWRAQTISLSRRKGIRYPNDQWSPTTGRPLANQSRLIDARIAFQTRRPHGPGVDIYVCNFEDTDMINATRNADVHASAIVAGTTGQEMFRWVDENTFECADNATGVWKGRVVSV